MTKTMGIKLAQRVRRACIATAVTRRPESLGVVSNKWGCD
jgi:hypothetical protein